MMNADLMNNPPRPARDDVKELDLGVPGESGLILQPTREETALRTDPLPADTGQSTHCVCWTDKALVQLSRGDRTPIELFSRGASLLPENLNIAVKALVLILA